MNELITEARNADLETMLEILRTQQAAKIDLVVPASKFRFDEANLVMSGFEADINADGVTDVNGLYVPTRIFDEKLAGYLNIPVAYVRRMREERPDLYDLNANGWLHGRKAKIRRSTPAEIKALETEENDAMFAQPIGEFETRWMTTVRPAVDGDARSFLLRLFQAAEGPGVARTVLSSKYKIMENLDGLMALLAGIREAGIDPSTLEITQCDLTERRMYVVVTAPEIKVAAPELLKGYRNPFAQGVERVEGRVRENDADFWRQVARREGMGYTEEEGGEPIVEAGLVFKNSEVGGGKYSLTPRIRVRVCKNGLEITEEAFGKVHLGGRMDEGRINWSSETVEANIALVRNETKDVVQAFLNPEFLQTQVNGLSERAGIKLPKPKEDVEFVAKKLSFTDDETAGILEHFMLGGQISAGGLMQAITSFSQTIEDGDRSHELEAKAIEAMDMAVARAK